MSHITGKNTKPELVVRKYLFSYGYRYRLNDKSLPGSPDIVLRKYKTAIFIHGCFWHGHFECKKSALPETRKDFWFKKINSNIERDKSNIIKLTQLGWNPIVVWQCEIRNKKLIEERLSALLKQIKGVSK